MGILFQKFGMAVEKGTPLLRHPIWKHDNEM
jgi:hypothetical protein